MTLVRRKNQSKLSVLTVNEVEKLQGVPLNYTEGVSNTQRYKMLGNGWTIPVIEHIFKGLANVCYECDKIIDSIDIEHGMCHKCKRDISR